MERGSGPDLEVGLEEHGALVDTHPPLAVMHGIRWVGMDEGTGGNEFGMLGIAGESLSCVWWLVVVGHFQAKSEKCRHAE